MTTALLLLGSAPELQFAAVFQSPSASGFHFTVVTVMAFPSALPIVSEYFVWWGHAFATASSPECCGRFFGMAAAGRNDEAVAWVCALQRLEI